MHAMFFQGVRSRVAVSRSAIGCIKQTPFHLKCRRGTLGRCPTATQPTQTFVRRLRWISWSHQAQRATRRDLFVMAAEVEDAVGRQVDFLIRADVEAMKNIEA